MITIFCTPRPFHDEFKIIQLNAIKSWTLLERDCQILLFEDEESTTSESISNLRGIEVINQYKTNEFGTPLIDDVFKIAREKSKFDILVHVNSDIILFPEFVDSLLDVSKKFLNQNFLLLGQRWDLDISEDINFNEDWKAEILKKIDKEGVLHGESGIDYWVFPKEYIPKPPPFCVGRPGMDTWLLSNSLRNNIPVINASKNIQVIHQNHGYPKKRAPHFEVECKRNIDLQGGFSSGASLRESTVWLDSEGEFLNIPIQYKIFQELKKYAFFRIFLVFRRWASTLISSR